MESKWFTRRIASKPYALRQRAPLPGTLIQRPGLPLGSTAFGPEKPRTHMQTISHPENPPEHKSMHLQHYSSNQRPQHVPPCAHPSIQQKLCCIFAA